MRAIFSLGYNYKAFDNGTASCLTIKSVKLLGYRYRYIPESELAEDNGKGRAFHLTALVLALAKIQDIF